MSELYGDIRELFEQGLSNEAIATVTGVPISMVRDCTELFDDFDYFPDGVSDPDYVVTGCDPAEYEEVL
jgi:hypothetical protein